MTPRECRSFCRPLIALALASGCTWTALVGWGARDTTPSDAAVQPAAASARKVPVHPDDVADDSAVASIPFEFKLDKESLTSAGVFDSQGRLVRQLWAMEQFPAGEHRRTWDGLGLYGQNVPPGAYEVRVIANHTTYTFTGTIGNNGGDRPMVNGVHDMKIDEATGDIYAFVGYDESGQDFKVMAADGTTKYDAKFACRNPPKGIPSGIPTSGAVGAESFYCSIIQIGQDLWGGEIIRKFSRKDGKPEPFADGVDYIKVHEHNPALSGLDVFKQVKTHSMVIVGDVLFAADLYHDKVHKFDTKTGKRIGEFAVVGPMAMEVDKDGRIWIAHHAQTLPMTTHWREHQTNRIGVYDVDGNLLGAPAVQCTKINALRMGPPGQLWIADEGEAQVKVYRIDSIDKLELVEALGAPAKPGESKTFAFGAISAFDVGDDGRFVIGHSPVSGLVMAAFDKDRKPVWQKVSLEYASNGAYHQDDPDYYVSGLLHSYRLTGRNPCTWDYLGNLQPNPQIVDAQSTGNVRILKIGGERYFFKSDMFKALLYRFDEGVLKPVALISPARREYDALKLGDEPPQQRFLLFSWADADGDALIEPDEVLERDFISNAPPICYGMDVDERGNLLIGDLTSRTVLEVPLTTDERGRPRWLWKDVRSITEPDLSATQLVPIKALRSGDGELLVLMRSPTYVFPPEEVQTAFGYVDHAGWMGGWVLRTYDASGRVKATISLPRHITAMDWIPDTKRDQARGLILGNILGNSYLHYTTDGLLIGEFVPPFRHGWMAHNGGVIVNRDPRDGIVDVTVMEDGHNRISWFRLDDSDIQTLRVSIEKPDKNEVYSTPETFAAAYAAAQAKFEQRDMAGAEQGWLAALPLGNAREQAFVRWRLGALIATQKERQAEALAYLRAATQSERLSRETMADALLAHAAAARAVGEVNEAIDLLKRVIEFRGLTANQTQPERAAMELGAICLEQGKLDEALAAYRVIQDLHRKKKGYAIRLLHDSYAESANVLIKMGKPDDAVAEIERGLAEARFEPTESARTRIRLAELLVSLDKPEGALAQYEAITSEPDRYQPDYACRAMIARGDLLQKLGKLDEARKAFAQAADYPKGNADLKKLAAARLQALEAR